MQILGSITSLFSSTTKKPLPTEVDVRNIFVRKLETQMSKYKFSFTKISFSVVKGGDSYTGGRAFESSAGYWMSNFYIVVKIVILFD